MLRLANSLEKQVFIYSVDTSFFYNEKELKIQQKLNRCYRFRTHLHTIKTKEEKKKNVNEDYIKKINKHLTYAGKRLKLLKERLHNEFPKNDSIREFNENLLSNKNIISVFDSVLIRTLGVNENELSKDVLVVQTYFFNILEDIIKDGFIWDDEKYVCFTASAGQIRTKKNIFLKESALIKHQKSLMCGLTVESINEQGGMNINKYLAYLALCNTASSKWDIDIDKAIVVDDMETNVRSLVDYIDDETYVIERKEMDIEINHTDGCGMILPKLSKKSFMCRLPFVKGLLVPFPFDKYIREQNRKNPHDKVGIVKDIYGKEYDLLKDEISVIFTKSQFKMWKYYKSWDEYKENFIKYNCEAGLTNEEEDSFNNAKLNYQMLQTLSDMTDKELKKISAETKERIKNIGSDRNTMLKVMGVIDSNKDKNYVQQALELYPELLNDTYCKEILKQVKKSIVKDGRAGKVDIDGKYTFICPDLYAFCEYLISGIENPKGLLADGEVYCNLYKEENKLDLLRSPHLFLEHAVRSNVIDKEKKRWFVTNGVYTSTHDVISKILMFDVDGDKSLVCADKTLIEVAERNIKKRDVVPLFYNMRKAEAQQINNESIYTGLVTAYTGGNIGMISNDITKIWNSGDINIDVIKWLCMENNFVIDFAKTLYKPTRPQEMNKLIKSYTKAKTPHFFIYAKDKEAERVEELNESVVNRLEKIIPNPIINFRRAKLGNFDFRMLMDNPDAEINESIVKKYTELDLKKRFIDVSSIVNDSSSQNIHLYKEIRDQILSVCDDVGYVTDVLVKYLYVHKNSSYKTTLWCCFGDVILENLKRNVDTKLKNTTTCDSCGERIKLSANNKRYCAPCAKEIDREKAKNRMKAKRMFEASKIL